MTIEKEPLFDYLLREFAGFLGGIAAFVWSLKLMLFYFCGINTFPWGN